MPTILTNGIQLPDKGSVDWYNSMQSNYNLIDTHLGNTDIHVTAEDKANWDSKQGSLSQAQLDAIAQVATNTSDIATLQSGKANASHTHSSSDITDIGDYATKQYVDNSISGLVDSAPNALDTLNELAAALNDDANFASTVTTALSAKANSADLATVAISGSYSDLSNKPSIPTKTSDLTNDSNFVDTSNSAVASGITSAKVTAYDSHVADTDIHVTTADKTKWNNGVSQAYVFRYSSTALVASSTNSNALLDNTDNLKVGDKVIDSSGVLFSITAIDSVNSTFTVGSALVDLALDANVVHTSGNETVGGNKTFTDNISLKSLTAEYTVTGASISVTYSDKNGLLLAQNKLGNYQSGISYNKFSIFAYDSNNQLIDRTLTYSSSSSTLATAFFRPDNDNIVSLGTSGNRWSKVYAVNYYYGNDGVEFSTKFVTSDTAQTVSGAKTFSGNVSIYNSDASVDAKYLILKNQKVKRGSTTETGSQFITFHDKDSGTLVSYETSVSGSGNTQAYINVSNLDANSQRVVGGVKIIKTPTETWFIPDGDNTVSSGLSNYKWKDVQTKLINGLTPSSLGMPATTGTVDISGYITALDGTFKSYTVPANGWISIAVVGTAIAIVSSRWSDSRLRESSGNVRMLYPVLKDETLNISVIGTTLAYARFFPCQGNI